MQKHLILLVFFSLLIAACDSSDQPAERDGNPEVISLLGDTLKSQPQSLPLELKNRIDSLSQAALDDSLHVQHLIWQGRLTAYEGNYWEAIEFFTDAIEQYPEDPRLYRHRGHRYITVRDFDKAIQDFIRAAELFQGNDDITEPDGLPNAENQPISSLQTNTWYHLGLAYYLKGDFDKANSMYENGLQITNNDDMRVAFLYWKYMALRRAGDDLAAGDLLEDVDEDLELIENDNYHQLLMVFKGVFKPEELLTGNKDALENATLGYGLGFWHFINGREDRAREIWQQVYSGENWAAFGYIASEAELARMK